jgi:ABC-type polysaccharide/polyol phosphate export permease
MTGSAMPAAVGSLWFGIQVMLATARVFVLKLASNTIMVIRIPLFTLFALIGFKLVYDISGQTTIPESQVLGFLVTGLLASGAWIAAIWGAGIALQSEMWSGTIGAVLIAPGSTTAVILGYAIGNFIFLLPAVGVTFITAQLMGASWDLSHPMAIVVALLAVYLSCICVGLSFGGLFILSRQANALANFLQDPVYLLGGFYVSRDIFPEWLQQISAIIPLVHALDALRGTALEGKSLSGIAEPLAWTAGTSAIFVLIGVWSLARLDRVVRRAGTLDLL